jgi:hypothetical protein
MRVMQKPAAHRKINFTVLSFFYVHEPLKRYPIGIRKIPIGIRPENQVETHGENVPKITVHNLTPKKFLKILKILRVFFKNVTCVTRCFPNYYSMYLPIYEILFELLNKNLKIV